MTHLHPRVVGQPPLARGSLLLIAAVAAFFIALTAPAYPHAGEFILAKLSTEKGQIRLELTIDCTDHPMIRSEEEARQILSRTLLLQVGGKSSALSDIAPFRYERRTSIDPEAPIPKDTHETDLPHRIVAALWQSDIPPSTITFQNAAHSSLSVILWQPPTTPGAQPIWTMLGPGDSSPSVTVHSASPRLAFLPYAVAGAVAIAIVIAFRRRARAPLNINDTP